MRITVLTDNTAGGLFLAEHGLSYLVEHKGTRVLFDTGRTDVFVQNARRLGCGLGSVDTVVLSHGHYDHGDGLTEVPGNGKRLVCHPDVFKRCISNRDGRDVGLHHTRKELERKYMISVSVEPVRLSEDITFLGAVPRTNDFEAKTTFFSAPDGSEDFMPDDSALAVTTDRGLVVISGCAHAGICNTVSHAVQVTGVEDILAVMGGFHLKKDDRITAATIAFMREKGVTKLLPSHCTELPALAAFYRTFGCPRVTTGMALAL